MEKSAKFKIKYALHNYKKFRAQGVISTVEWAEDNMAVDYSKVVVKSSPSNKNEAKICAELDKGLTAYRWCLVVEKVLDHYRFEQDVLKFIEEHFFKNKSDVATCLSLGVCRATFYNWQEKVIEIAYNWAKEYKLV